MFKSVLFMAFFCLLFCRPARAETDREADSLLVLIKSGKEDSNKVNAIDALRWKYIIEGEIELSRKYADAEMDLSKKIPFQKGIAASFFNTAYEFYYSGNYPKGLDNFLNALPEYEKLDYKRGIAATYTGLGLVYAAMKKDSLALKYQLLALDTKKKWGIIKVLASSYNNIGSIYASMKQYDKAIEYYTLCLDNQLKMGNKRGMSIALQNLGGNYREMGKLELAMDDMQLALKLKRELNDKPGLCTSLNGIGNIYKEEKKYTEALTCSLESYRLAKEVNSLSSIRDAANNLSDIYEHTGDPVKALAYYKEFISSRDSMFNEENTKKTVEVEMNYEFDKKEAARKMEQEKKDAIADQDKQKEKLLRNSFIAGFALVFLLALVVYRGYRQKRKANTLLSEQKEEIGEQKRQIEDSINYAQYIQRAILPDPKEIENTFPDIFGLYRPKDVVSGDFYWFAKYKGKALIAAADCTGHGVPGAFMSMIGSDKLSQAVNDRGLTSPAFILTTVNVGVKNALKQNRAGSTSRDGMDIALCSFDMAAGTMLYAGANRPLYLVRDGALIEYKATKTAIGGLTGDDEQFQEHLVSLKKGDCFYIFTDGFADQFGGDEGKKYMTRRFKDTLLAIHEKPMKEQEGLLLKHFLDWKGTREQVDDVLVIGVRI